MMNKTYWTLANLFSLGNAACGMISIFEAISGNRIPAGVFILIAVVFDFIDGKAARALKQDSVFGKAIDSLSDLISFGLAPAVLGFSLSPAKPLWFFVLLILFVLAGAWRLAFYVQWNKPGRPPGMPITFNGLFFPALFLAGAPVNAYYITFIVSIILMVLPIFLSRPTVS